MIFYRCSTVVEGAGIRLKVPAVCALSLMLISTFSLSVAAHAENRHTKILTKPNEQVDKDIQGIKDILEDHSKWLKSTGLAFIAGTGMSALNVFGEGPEKLHQELWRGSISCNKQIGRAHV